MGLTHILNGGAGIPHCKGTLIQWVCPLVTKYLHPPLYANIHNPIQRVILLFSLLDLVIGTAHIHELRTHLSFIVVIKVVFPNAFFFLFYNSLRFTSSKMFYSKTIKSVRPGLIEPPDSQWVSLMGRNTGGWSQSLHNLMHLLCTWLSKCGPPSAAWCPTTMASLHCSNPWHNFSHLS